MSGLEDGQPHNHRYTPTDVKVARSPYKMMMMMPAAILCGTTTPTGNRPLRRCRPQNSASAATFERQGRPFAICSRKAENVVTARPQAYATRPKGSIGRNH